MSEQSIWAGWKLTPPIQASTDGEASRRYQRAREKYKELPAMRLSRFTRSQAHKSYANSIIF